MKRPTWTMLTVTVTLAVASLGLRVFAQDADLDPKYVNLGKAEYSPYLDRGYPDRVYFGDTHLHTSYSTDAGMLGTVWGRRRPTDSPAARRSLRARASGRACSARYDFLVVSDHSENLGLAPMIAESNPGSAEDGVRPHRSMTS